MKQSTLNWATIGTGVIANELAVALEKSGNRLYSVANRTYEKGVAFAEKYGIKKVYRTIEEVFDDDAVDVIYISTPHNTHIPYLERALASGKHVLCEKSITLNSDELDRAIALAQANNVILAEAMTLYHMPLYKKLRSELEAGRFGDVQMIQLNFGSYKDYDMTNRFFNRNLAGGALLDIGVYALSLARLFMTSAPTQVTSQVMMAPSGVDERAGILLTNGHQMATIALTLHAKQPKRATIACDKGYIEIYSYPRGEKATFTDKDEQTTITYEEGATAEALVYEVLDMEAAIRGEAVNMRLEETQDVMRVMTQLRQGWGLVYPEEE